MKISDARKLHNGDEVFWTDPDNGLCSRHLVIKNIKTNGQTITIEDKNGDVLECFAKELS